MTNPAKVLIGFLLTAIVWVAQAEVLLGHVVGVSDGDTVTVIDQDKNRHVLRLMGIDAPEKAQAFGQRAKQSLSDLVFQKDVAVIWSQHDRYGRIVGKIMLNDLDVCLEQVRRGMAWHYKQYQREQSPQDRGLYADAEQAARADRVGLWADEHPLAPSTFRRNAKSAAPFKPVRLPAASPLPRPVQPGG